MKLFNKKFKTRVVHFCRDLYTVEYASYRLIPIWHTLKFWFEQSLTGGTERWSTELLKVEDAENLAKSLRSIEDVIEWYKPHVLREKLFYVEKKEYYEKAVPYSSKEFK
jgi:hypothetical protein